MLSESESLVIYSLALALPLVYLSSRYFLRPKPLRPPPEDSAQDNQQQRQQPKSIMQPARTDLEPPKDDPFTLAQLRQFDGSDESKPIYVAIRGTVFDVTHKKDVYGPGKSYNVFAGKDGSRGLGMSSLKPEDAVPDYSQLPENEMKVLDDWHSFFSKRYNIVGRVTDLPPEVSSNL